jgi:hypothetical protein
MILTDVLKSSMETASRTADESAFMPGFVLIVIKNPPLRWGFRGAVFCRRLAVLPRHLAGARARL